MLSCSSHFFIVLDVCVLGLAHGGVGRVVVVWFVMLLGVWDNLFVPFVDARQWADEFSLVCCGCLVLFENCIVDASIFFL